MAIQLVIIILRALCDKYTQDEKEQQKIYNARAFLDKAFSCYQSKSELQNIIQHIDDEFFTQINLHDSPQNIKAFIYTIALKAEII